MPKRLLPNWCETESIDDSDSDYVVSDGESITVAQPRLTRAVRRERIPQYETESIVGSESDYAESDGESITVAQPRLSRTIRRQHIPRYKTESLDGSESEYAVSDGESIIVAQPRRVGSRQHKPRKATDEAGFKAVEQSMPME
ncbi:hypothetical protein EYR36_001198 [Pleurotus pulmonarius]|nr:hypothetical protein EYR36_001198 [Pleurotus pulmonarius]KAF4603277.1 hypothetical protein EYR38_003690 [Pleurotus pulmonarius]